MLKWVPLALVLEAIAFRHPHSITNESILARRTEARANETRRLDIHALPLDWNDDEVIHSGIEVGFIKAERIDPNDYEGIWAIPPESGEENEPVIFHNLVIAVLLTSHDSSLKAYASFQGPTESDHQALW